MYLRPKNNKTSIAPFISLKYTDYYSLIKIFALLTALYNFFPIAVNTDFNFGQIKEIKNFKTLKKPPYVICCLFHFSQCIIRKLKELKIYKKDDQKNI